MGMVGSEPIHSPQKGVQTKKGSTMIASPCSIVNRVFDKDTIQY